jgi:hypothetical protein
MCFKSLPEMTPLPRIRTDIEPEAGEKLHHAASLHKLFFRVETRRGQICF